MRRVLLTLLLLLGARAPARAQLLAARESTIAYGHHHINASYVEAHKRFWVDALGGALVRVGTSTTEAVRFPNVLVFFSARTPSGGTRGTVVNHVGFETRDLRAAVARLRAGGFRMVTREKLPAAYEVTDDLGQRAGGNVIAFVLGPDETKVELIENMSIAHPLQLHPSGITMDRGYTQVPALGIAVAFLTDPWGTYVELTEGMTAVE